MSAESENKKTFNHYYFSNKDSIKLKKNDYFMKCNFRCSLS